MKKFVLLATLVGVGSYASATALVFSSNGQLNFGNLSVAVGGNPATGCIDFYNSTQGCGTSATATLGAGSDALFGTVGTTTGTLMDIGASQTFPEVNSFVIGTSHFDLESIIVPSPSACPPSATPGSCTFGDFVLTQNTLSPNTMSVSLSELLCGYTTSAGTGCSTGTPYIGIFTAQFSGTIDATTLPATVQNLINIVVGGGIVSDTVSAAFSPVSVPEPITFSMMGAGLLGLGLLRRKLVKK